MSVVVPLLQQIPAEAAPFAGPEHQGYFLNKVDNWGDTVLSNGLYPVAGAPYGAKNDKFVLSFISLIEDKLNGDGTKNAAQNQTGAEFIILTMMGYKADTPKSKAHSKAVVQEWERTVKNYSTNGWIDWDVDGVSHKYNTYWQGNGQGSNPDDDAYYIEAASDNNVIVFNGPGAGNFYRIKKACGNPIGDNEPLIKIDPPKPDTTLNLSSLSDGGDVTPGQVVRIGIRVDNEGKGPQVGQSKAEIQFPAAGIDLPCTPACKPTTPLTPPQLPMVDFVTYGSGTNWGFRSTPYIAAGAPLPTGRTWYWLLNPIPASPAYSSAYIDVRIADNAVDGSTITFTGFYSGSGTDPGDNLTDIVTLHVVSPPRTPNFQALGSDVHAGGCISVGQGNVVGNTSYGQYIVSASSSNISVGSNGAVGDSSLRAAGYAPVCLPTLATKAADACVSSATYGTLSGPGPFNVGTLPGGKDTYCHVGGGAFSISGTVNRKITIVQTTPDAVTISGNIVIGGVAPSVARTDLPALGILSMGPISISGNATTVDAYLFSNSSVNTCAEDINSAQCASVLTVHGFLMGRSMLFNRTGPRNTTGAVTSEVIQMSPLLYLNPPRFFDDIFETVLLEGQGELRPLF